jgi:hypothetical protein
MLDEIQTAVKCSQTFTPLDRVSDGVYFGVFYAFKMPKTH